MDFHVDPNLSPIGMGPSPRRRWHLALAESLKRHGLLLFCLMMLALIVFYGSDLATR